MTDPADPPERYTSYHHPPEKTFSILNEDRTDTKPGHLYFEYNGIQYALSGKALRVLGPMPPYVVPYWEGKEREIATFPPADFTSFIRTYEIEGRTLEWILEHQREWKYKLTADHFANHVRGFHFMFVYRGAPCWINPFSPEGWYLYLATGIPYDVKSYAPLTPGAEHWSQRIDRVFYTEEGPQVRVGPYATPSILLDTVRFDGKTLRELFDTEYDDGEVLCGVFEG